MKKIWGITIGLALMIGLFAQNTSQVVFDKHLNKLKSASDNSYVISVDSSATAFVLAIEPTEDFEGAYIVLKGDTINLKEDDDNNGTEGLKFSNLIANHSNGSSFIFYPASIKRTVTIYFIQAGLKKGETIQSETKKKSAGCSSLSMIDQSVWREGLPEPIYDRINQKVLHVIIHHTAGSNTDTNYTQTVRDIYVYHTQVRLWSDIGYNYLIAPSGDIYKGRDPGEYEQDNVMGAHFCNSNSTTMGISMMGTFTDTVPSDTAFQSLISLINWKLGKEQLNPYGLYYHALNPELPAIAGHRDGCATECPGNALYAEMDSIRAEVMKKFSECGYTITSVDSYSDEEKEINIRYLKDAIQLSTDDLIIESVSIFDFLGRSVPLKIELGSDGNAVIYVNHKLGGVYFIRCKVEDGVFTGKVIL